MPIYAWQDKKSKQTVEVVRSFADYEQPPTAQEVIEAKVELTEPPEWERVIGKVGVKKGYRWGGGKGNWVVLTTLGGLACAGQFIPFI